MNAMQRYANKQRQLMHACARLAERALEVTSMKFAESKLHRRAQSSRF